MIKLSCNELKGKVVIPPSKSLAHRALVLASLAKHEVVVKNISYSNDILATISCLEGLGATIIKQEDSVIVRPSQVKKVHDINCGESGTTLRFMIPYALLQGETIAIDGENRLKIRPIDDYFPMLEQNQVQYQYNGSLPIVLTGHLQSGVYELNGNVSSQFISGLLLVLPFLKGDSKVIIKNKLESKPYVDMTVKIAKEFGINIYEEGNIYTIPGNQEGVNKTINLLIKNGCNVITHSPLTDTHTSGHASQGELKLIQALLKPKYFLPVHGEYRMQRVHADLAISCGVKKENAFVLENGDVFCINERGARIAGHVHSGEVYIDGNQIGDVSGSIIRERKVLAEDGLFSIIVTINPEKKLLPIEPQVVSRGFIYMKDSEELTKHIVDMAKKLHINLFQTDEAMFEACGKLYTAGK